MTADALTFRVEGRRPDFPPPILHPTFRMVDTLWRTTRRARWVMTAVLVGVVALVLAGSTATPVWRRALRGVALAVVAVGLYFWRRTAIEHERLQYHLNCKVEMQLGQATPVSCKPPWA